MPAPVIDHFSLADKSHVFIPSFIQLVLWDTTHEHIPAPVIDHFSLADKSRLLILCFVQVVLWDTTHEHERIARMKAASNKQETQDAGDEAAIPVVKYK